MPVFSPQLNNTIINGNGAPVGGNNNDYWVDNTNSRWYGPKAGGVWPSSFVTIVGTNGTNGTNGRDAGAFFAAYPSGAATNIPRGLTQASVGALTPGASGTNGTFNAVFSGGNMDINPTATFTVSGNQLTAFTITGPGLYVGSSISLPTVSFAASSGLVGAAVALTAQLLVQSGQGYWVQSVDGYTIIPYNNVSGTATLDASKMPIATTNGTARAATIASANKTVSSIKAAIAERGTLKLLLLDSLGQVEFSPGILSAWNDQSGNGNNASLYSTLWSGADPRPKVTSQGIYCNFESGFTLPALLTKADKYAIHYGFEIPVAATYVSVSAMNADIGSRLPGDIVEVTSGLYTTYSPDVTNVFQGGYPDANLQRGFYQLAYNSVYVALSTIIYLHTPSGHFITVGINRLGQATFTHFGLDGVTGVLTSCITTSTRVVGNGRHQITCLREPDNLYITLDRHEIGAIPISQTNNILDIDAFYINGRARNANPLIPVGGTRHYVTNVAVTDDCTWAAARDMHNLLSDQYGTPRFEFPKRIRAWIGTGQSLQQASTNTSTDTWTGPGAWNGMFSRENATNSGEHNFLTREFIPNVFAPYRSSSASDQKHIGPLVYFTNSSGTTAGGYTSADYVEGFDHGFAKQFLNHPMCPKDEGLFFTGNAGFSPSSNLFLRSTPPLLVEALGRDSFLTITAYERVLQSLEIANDHFTRRGCEFIIEGWRCAQGFAQPTASDVLLFYDQFNVDAKKISGQAQDVKFLIPAINVSADGTTNAASILADQSVLDAVNTRGTRQIYATRVMTATTNHIHHDRPTYRCGGEKDGQIAGKLVFERKGWEPLRVKRAIRNVVANSLDLVYYVQSGVQLHFEDNNGWNISGRIQTGGVDTYGFKYAGGGRTITGVSIITTDVTNDTVRLSLSGSSTIGDVYSYVDDCRYGNLVDDDPWPAFYRDADRTLTIASGLLPYGIGNLNDMRNRGMPTRVTLTT